MGRKFPQSRPLLPLIVLLLALAGCADESPQALGTLEYDRIALPAPAAERIVAIEVREGERVVAGQPLLRLETTRTAATTQAAQAEAQRQRAALAELEAGPRSERIAQSRAQLAAAQAQARDAQAYYARLQPLGARKLVAAADVDRARAAAGNAQAQVRAARRDDRQPAVQARRPGAGGRAAGDPAGRRRALCAGLCARADPRLGGQHRAGTDRHHPDHDHGDVHLGGDRA